MAKLTSTQKSTGDSSSRKLRHDHSDDNEHDEDPEDGHGSGDNGDTGDDGISSNEADDDDLDDVMDREGFAGPSERVVKPLTAEGVAAFNAEIARTGVIYISRIPPGMRPEKVRHLMSQHGEVGRVYLQKEDPKVSYLRRKYTTDKKPHFVEGWVEFKDKKVARTVATMLNAQPIGGKKGTRWRDDVWTMTYLPKFKWNMLTEQIAHEAAARAAKLRVEIAQSRSEQNEYLKNVELARIVNKRNEKRKEKGLEPLQPKLKKVKQAPEPQEEDHRLKKRPKVDNDERDAQLQNVLGCIF
ncbi:hypothetical protein SCLCIDRAFT_1206603 [Scleroderma citrinum Foug A]|uniref:18S rRNA factor 2 n=1 Tax=Scleroderma citrinum Foug A TaxID=1036808 RepID=A0A0C3EQN6_9AGAM|nr:hypothetical protein SCLCIDRAFT_1206603 [Scleroderma citrinum Foug A]